MLLGLRTQRSNSVRLCPTAGRRRGYGIIGVAEATSFQMINEQGGLNGRKLNFISLDDGYNAPKAVGQTRRLVEQEQVAFIFGQLGGFTSLAARQYLNENEKEETLMTAIDATPAKWDLSRRGFLRRSASGFAAAIAITSTGALLNVSEAWAVEV